MNLTYLYEEYKRELNKLNLSRKEYQRRIREWCRQHNY